MLKIVCVYIFTNGMSPYTQTIDENMYKYNVARYLLNTQWYAKEYVGSVFNNLNNEEKQKHVYIPDNQRNAVRSMIFEFLSFEKNRNSSLLGKGQLRCLD